MDNLAHTLVGAALGQAGLKKRTGLGMATLMIAANLPDLDVLAIPFGGALSFRRGWTHGPVAWFVLPVLLTVAMVLWDQWQTRRGTRPQKRPPVFPLQVLLLASIGVLSHPFFDWLNNYGIRVLMPFSEELFYGDALFIIDPWLWSVLGAGIYLSRWRERRFMTAPLRPARIAVVLAFGYVALMIAGSRWAGHAATQAIQASGMGPVERIMTGPVPLNPAKRQLIWDNGEAYGFGDVLLSPVPKVSLQASMLEKGDDHPLVEVARRQKHFDRFLAWSRFPYLHVVEVPGGHRVEARDARYGDYAEFSAAAVILDK